MVTQEGLRLHVQSDHFEETAPETRKVVVAIRPQKASIDDKKQSKNSHVNILEGKVISAEYQGATIRYQVAIDGSRIIKIDENNKGYLSHKVDQQVYVLVPAEDCFIISDGE